MFLLGEETLWSYWPLEVKVHVQDGEEVRSTEVPRQTGER